MIFALPVIVFDIIHEIKHRLQEIIQFIYVFLSITELEVHIDVSLHQFSYEGSRLRPRHAVRGESAFLLEFPHRGLSRRAVASVDCKIRIHESIKASLELPYLGSVISSLRILRRVGKGRRIRHSGKAAPEIGRASCRERV